MKEGQVRARGEEIILAALIVLGVVARAFALGKRSLWLDEAWVANLIEAPHFVSAILYEKAWYWSPLPFLFALTSKFSSFVLGPSEMAYRLFPCFFGLGAVGAFILLSRRLFSKNEWPWLWMVPVVFLALHHKALYYSRELKQFSGELFVSVALLFLFFRLIDRLEPRALICFFLTALLGIGYGIGVNLLIVVLLAFLFGHAFLHERRQSFTMILPTAAGLGVAALVHYFAWLRPQMDPDYYATWAPWVFAPERVLGIPIWLARRAGSFIKNDFGFSTLLLSGSAAFYPFIPLFVLGLAYWVRKRQYTLLAIYGAVMGIQVLLAFLRLWPLGGSRVNLFLLPFHLLFASAGIAVIAAWLEKTGPKSAVRWVTGLSLGLALLPSQGLEEALFRPKGREEMRLTCPPRSGPGYEIDSARDQKGGFYAEKTIHS